MAFYEALQVHSNYGVNKFLYDYDDWTEWTVRYFKCMYINF